MNTDRATRVICRWLLVWICLGWSFTAMAQDDTHQVFIVSPDSTYTTIDAALVAAQPGDTIEVHGGQYAAPLLIEKSVSLIGLDNPIIDGHGTGSLVIITAPDVRFEGFVVRNSGVNVNHEDTGIVVQASRVTVASNSVEDVLFGIYFANASEGTAQGNTVRCVDRELGVRGDGIRVWFSSNVVISGNTVTTCRDTLIWYAQHVTIINNVIQNSRYGLHFMYSSDADIEGNTFEGNSVGSYLMYSQRLTMTQNHLLSNRGPSGYGIALKDMDYVTLQDNLLIGNRAGLYLDNSPALYNITNTVSGNFFAYNDIGIAALPSTARNIFQGNTFLENLQQISVQGRGNLLGNTWQQDGTGNYWSDYVGYDGNHDGQGDMPYRSEKLFESLTDNEPVLRIFSFSPVTQAIDFAAAAFPSLRPDPKVIDEAPLMHYTIPTGLTAAPQGISLVLLFITLGLLGSGAALWAFAMHGTFHRNRSGAQPVKITPSGLPVGTEKV